jgi:hypothetical protein
MRLSSRRLLTPFNGLLAGIIVLQLIMLGVVVRYGNDSARRDTTLLERTEVMVDDMLPRIHQDLSGVSEKVTDIKGDVTLLRRQVDQVDQQVGMVNKGVSGIALQLDAMSQTMLSFFYDTSGLIWGHSLNPYVMMALLLAILLSVPGFGVLFARRRRAQAAAAVYAEIPADQITKKLDDLSKLIQQMREEQKTSEASVEMKRLMEETERLIRDARANLMLAEEKGELEAGEPARTSETIH